MTSRLPAKCLGVAINDIDATAFRSVTDPLGPGQPYRWEASLDVTAQFHSSISTPRQLLYDARDVAVGDYIGIGRPIRVYKIISIVSVAGPDQCRVGIEDLEGLAALQDFNQGGNGAPQNDSGILFAADEDNPILFPLPNPLPSDLDFGGVVELLSQFKFLQTSKYITVYQPGNGFVAGDMISLKEDATYVKTYVAGNPEQYPAIGYVVDIDYPQADFFRYKAAGPIIRYPTATGLPGQKFYLDSTNSGAITATVPAGRRYPTIIKIDNVTAIWIGYSQQEGLAASFVVPTQADLTALADAVEGDFAYVENMGTIIGDGEWGLFFRKGTDWKLIATEDSATTDAKTIKVNVEFDGPATINAHRLSADSRVVNVAVIVTQTWNDPTATLTLGDDSVNDRFMPADLNDLTELDEFQTLPSYKYPGLVEPIVKVFLNSAGATQGSAQVIFTYV